MPREFWSISKPNEALQRLSLWGIGSSLNILPGVPRGEMLSVVSNATPDGRLSMVYDVDGFRAVLSGRVRLVCVLWPSIMPRWIGPAVRVQGTDHESEAYCLLLGYETPSLGRAGFNDFSLNLLRMPVGGPSALCSQADFPGSMLQKSIHSSLLIGSTDWPLFHIELAFQKVMVEQDDGTFKEGVKFQIFQNQIAMDIDLTELLEVLSDTISEAGGTIPTDLNEIIGQFDLTTLQGTLEAAGVHFTQTWDLLGEVIDSEDPLPPGYLGASMPMHAGRFTFDSVSYGDTEVGEINVNTSLYSCLHAGMATSYVKSLLFQYRASLVGSHNQDQNNGIYAVNDVQDLEPYTANIINLITPLFGGGDPTVMVNETNMDFEVTGGQGPVLLDSIEMFVEQDLETMSEEMFTESFEDRWPFVESFEEVIAVESFETLTGWPIIESFEGTDFWPMAAESFEGVLFVEGF